MTSKFSPATLMEPIGGYAAVSEAAAVDIDITTGIDMSVYQSILVAVTVGVTDVTVTVQASVADVVAGTYANVATGDGGVVVFTATDDDKVGCKRGSAGNQ